MECGGDVVVVQFIVFGSIEYLVGVGFYVEGLLDFCCQIGGGIVVDC